MFDIYIYIYVQQHRVDRLIIPMQIIKGRKLSSTSLIKVGNNEKTAMVIKMIEKHSKINEARN